MILNYDRFNNGYFKSYDEREEKKAKYILEQLELREKRKEQKEKLIEELNYEKDLIVSDIVNVIKNDLVRSNYNPFLGFDSEMFSKVFRYFNSKKNLKDEEKKEYKTCFNFVTSFIKEKFLLNNEEFKLVCIIDYNFSQGYEFVYEYKKQKFSIYIPIFQNTTEKNYKEMLVGYKICHYEKEWVSKLIVYGLDYNKVAEDFKKWRNKNE